MKAAFNIKVFFILLFLTFLASVFYSNIANALDPSGSISRNNPECTGNAGGVITQPGTTDCEVTPDSQKITWYRVEFCKSKPTGPTTSATVDRSDCFTFYQNDSGSEVTIAQGVGTQIGTAADYTAVPYGNYTYGVITMGATFKFTTSVTFDGNISDGTNSSTTCVTKASSLGTIYGYHDNINTFAKANMSCASGATAAEITIGVNTLTADGAGDCNHLLTFQGTSVNVAAYLLESNGTLHDGVGATDTDQIKNTLTGCVVTGSANGISFVQGIMPLDLKITPETTGIQISYNNTRGISLDMSSTSNQMYKFDSAFFDFSLSAL
ncbi:hypothetical protein N9A41_00425 [Candidatus Pelagibacter ubique]|nr:hypothetical protein [Candidatus Pelagibacter ubique]MDB9735127.1 hypothetical protein [Candidatus Pelagibacter ubique]